MSVKTKSQNECFFLCISTSPLPHKEKTKWWVYSCGELVWNDPIIGLLDIAHRCKILHLCYL